MILILKMENIVINYHSGCNCCNLEKIDHIRVIYKYYRSYNYLLRFKI